jgi:D-amino peptidase
MAVNLISRPCESLGLSYETLGPIRTEVNPVKVFIGVDMEGISGVVAWDQTERGKSDYEVFRRYMTKDANAAIEGALAAGASKIVVTDSHNGGRNILPEDLNPEATLVTGGGKPMAMVEGLDSTFDAAFFIGYHSRCLSLGVLNHTYSLAVQNYLVNGKVMGETGMNALMAAYYGVPVVLVSGDCQVCQEAKDLLGTVETVAVKEPRSQTSAMGMHPLKARAQIKDAAERALSNLGSYKAIKAPVPATVRLQFRNSAKADAASIMPGSVRVDPVTVEYTGADYLMAYRGALTMLHL